MTIGIVVGQDMIKWWFECSKCNAKLHPENLDGKSEPNEEEMKWVQEHFSHGIEMVFEKPDKGD